MTEHREGVGSQWKINDGNYSSPEANDTGPNQILLLDDFFKNGSIEAVVQPTGCQPGYSNPRLECSLIGRYRSPQCYITAGVGGFGREFFISEVAPGGFRRLATEGGRATEVKQGQTRRLRLEFNGATVQLYQGEKVVATGQTSCERGGRCGLRVDWTQAHFEAISVKNNDKSCLVVAAFGEEGSDTRDRSDRVLQRIIRPTTADCGYNAQRADHITGPGEMSQFMQHLLKDPLVVADLTGENPNVYYELAIRHATRKPFVQLIQKGQELPFDVQNLQAIKVEWTDAGVERAKDEMRKQIEMIDRTAGEIIKTSIPLPWTLGPCSER